MKNTGGSKAGYCVSKRSSLVAKRKKAIWKIWKGGRNDDYGNNTCYLHGSHPLTGILPNPLIHYLTQFSNNIVV
jgi:hypothetical protein